MNQVSKSLRRAFSGRESLPGRGNCMCKIPDVIFFLIYAKTRKMFIKPGEKRLQNKIIGEEIFGDQVKLSIAFVKRGVTFFQHESIPKRVMIDLTFIVQESLWLLCGEQTDTGAEEQTNTLEGQRSGPDKW